MDRDYAEKEFFADSVNFAELLNGFLYDGKQVIAPEDLLPLDPIRHIRFVDSEGNEKLKERIADISKQMKLCSDGLNTYAVILEQNQTKTDYGMPFRNLVLEVAEYMSQAEKIAEDYASKKKKKISFISDFQPGDLLRGVISITVFFSSEDWDGPESFQELLDSGEGLKKYMINLPLNLIVPARMSAEEILRKYTNDLGMVFMYLKFCTDQSNLHKMFSLYGLHLSEMKLKTAELIKTITGDDFFYNVIINSSRNGKDGPDMSEGMKQIIETATAEGKAQGFDEGRRIRNREITIRLSEKGYSADGIAELIGLDLQTVQRILAD